MKKRARDKERRINVELSAELSNAIDDWRRQQADLPNLSQAIRRLLEAALKLRL